MYAALALGFGIVANLAPCGYAMKRCEQFIRNAAAEIEVGCRYLQAGKNSECRIPVNLGPNDGPGSRSFQLVLDNEPFVEPQYVIKLFTKSNGDSRHIHMRVDRKIEQVQINEVAVQHFLRSDSSKDSKGKIVGFKGKVDRNKPGPKYHIYTGEHDHPARGKIVYDETDKGKYLELAISATQSIHISCLEEKVIWYRRSIGNKEAKNTQEVGPYEAVKVSNNSYYRLDLFYSDARDSENLDPN